jgi:Undecaprenyl-phosphate galactose phosphotransferase WbaP
VHVSEVRPELKYTFGVLDLRVQERRTGSDVDLDARERQLSQTPGDECVPEQRASAPSLILVPTELHSYVRAISPARWRTASKRGLIPGALLFSDAVLALLVWWVASVLQGVWGQGALSASSVAILVPVTVGWVAIRAFLGLYPGYGLDPVERLRRHTYSAVATLALLAIFALAFEVGDRLSRPLLVLVFLGLLVLGPFAQLFTRWVLKRIGWWGKAVLVLGYRMAGTEVAGLLKEEWELGYDPVAALDYRLEKTSAEPLEDVRGQKGWAGVVDLAREHGVDTAIFAMPHTRREHLAELVSLASLSFRHVMVVPNLGGITNSAVAAKDLAGTFAVEIKYNLLDPWALRTKRALDVIATIVGGTLILPFLLMLALLIYLESGRPVFYKDERMGKDGKQFSCLKFRTMVSNAETLLQTMLEEDAEFREEYSKYHKLRYDPRVTRVGRFLRRTSLDELPQIWNVLCGGMSLVGPRPYLPRESHEIGLSQNEILRVPPGITGPWQVSGRNHVFFSERIKLDARYVRDWSVWLDIVLLARTVRTLLFDRAAY